ncbi:MAG: hypothetical protein ACRENG_17755 [bacterium]
MQKTSSYFALAMAALSVAALVPTSLPAQSLWLDRSHDKTIALEVIKPDFKNNNLGTFTSSRSGLALFLSLRWPLSERLHFVGELPFAYGNYEFKSSLININEHESGSAIGNPYLGLEIKGANTPIFAEFGVRLPITPEDNVGTGLNIYSDVDRIEAFFPKTLPFSGMVNFHHVGSSGLAIRLRGGASFWVFTDMEAFNEDTELFASYSAQVGYEFRQVSVMAGFTGRANLTAEDADFSQRSVHQFGAAASLGAGKVRPGVQLRLPLDDDLKDILDAMFGVQLGIEL